MSGLQQLFIGSPFGPVPPTTVEYYVQAGGGGGGRTRGGGGGGRHGGGRSGVCDDGRRGRRAPPAGPALPVRGPGRGHAGDRAVPVCAAHPGRGVRGLGGRPPPAAAHGEYGGRESGGPGPDPV